MNTADAHTPNTRLLAATLLLCLAALAACGQPRVATAPASQVSAPVATMPAPQEPLDTTPITPVESAGASGE